jgi:copper oxidase (laccase) domain-containing protein
VIRRDINGLRYYQFASLSAEPVRHGVFSRLGGVSRGPFASLNLSASVPDDPRAVTENRRRFYAALGVDPNRAIRAIQVHGARVAAVNSNDLAVVQPATDGLLTATPGLPLVMAFADCTPILLYDPVRRAVGMVHAGWRGTVAGICQAAVDGMVAAFGSDPAAGVSQIERSGICTACHVDEFFSHRAERGRTGRFGAIIMLDPCGAD